jgi:hypothetical protein
MKVHFLVSEFIYPMSVPACLPACLPACPPACLPARLPACLPACLPAIPKPEFCKMLLRHMRDILPFRRLTIWL